MPWLDPEKLGPLNLGHYLYAYLGLGLPSLFATGAILFALATATRSMMATYVGVIALLILYFVTLTTLRQLQLSDVAPWADPFGIGAYSQATRYFTTADRNSIEPALWGPLVWSRALWVGIGLLFLGLAYVAYRPRLVGKAERSRNEGGQGGRQGAEDADADRRGAGAGAATLRRLRPRLAQLWARTRFDMGIVFRSPAFLVLLALGAAALADAALPDRQLLRHRRAPRDAADDPDAASDLSDHPVAGGDLLRGRPRLARPRAQGGRDRRVHPRPGLELRRPQDAGGDAGAVLDAGGERRRPPCSRSWRGATRTSNSGKYVALVPDARRASTPLQLAILAVLVQTLVPAQVRGLARDDGRAHQPARVRRAWGSRTTSTSSAPARTCP